MMRLDAAHPLNFGVLEFLRGRAPKRPAIESRDAYPDPYEGLGSHPEIVERVWDALGSRMPVDCRCLVYRTPALVHPASGVVFAFAFGTTYCLRFTPSGYQEALGKGYTTLEHWPDGKLNDLSMELGPDWLWGGWKIDEVRWTTAMYEWLNQPELRGTR